MRARADRARAAVGRDGRRCTAKSKVLADPIRLRPFSLLASNAGDEASIHTQRAAGRIHSFTCCSVAC